ncbi:MAG TPA: RNase adapter RapZ, partial [Ramlibacter sp.]|nr:RNase adapter RapZ [Ramlibacter sp.]
MSLELVLITGMSGSGKSVALRALEDAGYYCVDNLPPELLLSFVALEQQNKGKHVAIAMDVRSATSLPQVPAQLRELRDQGVHVRSLFLDSTTDTLVRRFSETRRRHPLSQQGGSEEADPLLRQRALVDAI